MQPGDHVHTERRPRRAQRPDNGITDWLTGYSDSLQDKVTEGSRKLLPRTTGSYTKRCATQSTVIIRKDGFAIPVSVDGVTKMPRMPDEAKPLARLHSTMVQPDLNRQGAGQKNIYHPTDPNDPEPMEYVIDRIFGCRGTGTWVEYEVRWYGIGAKSDKYKPALELPTNFVRRYLTNRRQYSAPRSERTGERTEQRKG